MKHILLMFTLVGLTACSVYVAKNESGQDVSAGGETVADNECKEWMVFAGFFGDTTISFKTMGDNPEQIGDKAEYPAGHYVVSGVTQDASAVQSVDTAPDCSEVDEELVAAKAAAEEAANAAITAAEAAVEKAEKGLSDIKADTNAMPNEIATAAEKKQQADAVKTEADAVKTEADAADTVEKADAAKAKAEGIQAKADAI